MNNLQIKVRTLSNAGTIQLEKILPVAQEVDNERAEALELFKKCVNQVGMYLGEEISEMIAKIEGRKFSAVDYFHERMPGEQGI